MRIYTVRDAKYVLRRVGKQVYAAAFSMDMDERQIKSWMMKGDAAFFPFDKETWEFDWSKVDGRPRYIRR